MDINELYTGVLDCAFKVHRALGPGLLESVYLECLAYELRMSGYSVEGRLIIELKAVSEMKEVHMAQLLTYMRFSGVNRGLLLNFNTTRLKNGIKRAVITQ